VLNLYVFPPVVFSVYDSFMSVPLSVCGLLLVDRFRVDPAADILFERRAVGRGAVRFRRSARSPGDQREGRQQKDASDDADADDKEFDR
jgi:hypothetical protein